MKKSVIFKLKILFAIFLFIPLSISTRYTFSDTLNGFPYYSVKGETFSLIAEYKTNYSSSIQNRKDNIKLTAKFLNGIFIDAGAEFSFNKTVGERTENRGFKVAKIIVGGKYTDGVGGGVCQVSTTLYNAVLLSGLKVTEYHAHSLPVGYVPVGFDAMVSYRWADLRFINDTGFPVILSVTANDDNVSVKIYGKKPKEKIILKSFVTEQLLPQEEIIVDDGTYALQLGESIVITEGKIGLKSESYLYYYDTQGKIIRIVKFRKDAYLPQNKIIVIGSKNEKTD